MAIVKELKSGQASIRQLLDSKIDNLSKDINKKFGEMKNELRLELARLDRKFDELEVKVQQIQEAKFQSFDPEKTIVVSGLHYDHGLETPQLLEGKVEALLEVIKASPQPGADVDLQAAEIVGVLNMPLREEGRYPIVKVEFKPKNQKISVLRAKQVLKNSKDYKRVYLRTSKPYEVRIMEKISRLSWTS